MKTMKGPGIFLAQFAGDEAPFNTLAGMAGWAASLGYTGVQIPSWDGRLFDLAKAAESQTYCDEITGLLASHGLEPARKRRAYELDETPIGPFEDLNSDMGTETRDRFTAGVRARWKDMVRPADKAKCRQILVELVVVHDLPGETVRDRWLKCQAQKLPGIPRLELLGHLLTAARTLDELQQQYGLQHLGLNPRNMMLVKGELQIADFGLMALVWLPSGQLPAQINPRYSAPELFQRHLSKACDQYSLALIFYELLTGDQVHGNRTPSQLARARNLAPRIAAEVAPTVTAKPARATAPDKAETAVEAEAEGPVAEVAVEAAPAKKKAAPKAKTEAAAAPAKAPAAKKPAAKKPKPADGDDG